MLGRRTSRARSQHRLVVGRAYLERHLGFGADEGAAGVVRGGAGGDAAAGAGRGGELGRCYCEQVGEGGEEEGVGVHFDW